MSFIAKHENRVGLYRSSVIRQARKRQNQFSTKTCRCEFLFQQFWFRDMIKILNFKITTTKSNHHQEHKKTTKSKRKKSKCHAEHANMKYIYNLHSYNL